LAFQVWQLGSPQPNYTLEGHEKGVNTIDYYHGGDKPYLISGADDRLVKIWDYQVRNRGRRIFFLLINFAIWIVTATSATSATSKVILKTTKIEIFFCSFGNFEDFL
jgi:WD40 repeat protein